MSTSESLTEQIRKLARRAREASRIMGELDTNTGAEVFRCLRDLHEKEQTTIIVVTHDQAYITNDDRIVHMRDGRVVDDCD